MHAIDLPAWALARGRAMNFFPRIDCARTALLVVDMQNAFILEDQVFGNPHARDIVPSVNRLAAALRAASGMVIWTRQTASLDPALAVPAWQWNRGDPVVRRAIAALSAGAHGHRLHDGLDGRESDAVFDKYRYSAFIQQPSPTHAWLRARGVDTLIVAGTLTNVCCESSARDAYMLGYRIVAAADAMAALTDAEHNASLLNLCLNFADVRMTEDIIALIHDSAGPPDAPRTEFDRRD